MRGARGDFKPVSEIARLLMRALPMLLVCSVGACVEPVVSMAPATHAFTAKDYEDVYGAWTRSAEPFDFGKLSSVLFATATFESREFRWAYVVRYGQDFGLATEARNAMLTASLSDASEHHRFLVTLGGTEFRELDMTHERGAWRVLLMDDRGRQVRPLEIEKIRRPTPAERTYFPSMTPFRQAFRVVFPVKHEDGYPTVPPEARFVTLRFTGPEGQVNLQWDFRHD